MRARLTTLKPGQIMETNAPAYKRAGIGFLASLSAKPESLPAAAAGSAGSLFTFDSGQTVSFLEASANVLTAGSTGRGKSTSVVLPALEAVIRAGFGGIAIDVKGNFSAYTRALARRYGREADILELGTGPQATPINLFNGLSMPDIERLMRSVCIGDMEARTWNMDWHLKGVKIVVDMILLLRLLAERDPVFTPNLVLLNAMVTDYKLTRSLMGLFRESVCDADRYDHVLFRDSLQEFAFTPLMPRPTGNGSKQAAEWDMQVEWNLQPVRRSLGLLSGDPKLRANFASLENPDLVLDFGDLVYRQRKIVLLRFDPQTTVGGARIARFIKEKFYQDAYAHGLALEPGEFTFAIMDEFQDIVDLTPDNPFNDSAWLAKSREFRNINVLATQSFASLYAMAERPAAVDSMLNNCSTKILLQMDDPSTNAYLKAFPDLPCLPSELGRGRCLVLRFDMVNREFVICEDGTQMSYESSQSSLAEVLARGRVHDSSVATAAPAQGPMHPSGLARDKLEMVIGYDPLRDKGMSAAQDKEEHTGELEDVLEKASPHLLDLYRLHRNLFSPQIRAQSLAVPPGWLPIVAWCLGQIENLEVPVRIDGIGERFGSLVITIWSDHPATVFAEEAQRLSLRTCMLCGGRIIRREPRQRGKDNEHACQQRIARRGKPFGSDAPLCSACKGRAAVVTVTRALEASGLEL